MQAAGLPETCFTVWINVFERGRLAPGETLLVQGGSSGIGVTAIQLASAWASRVRDRRQRPRNAQACEALGAERAINYRSEDFVEVVQELTGGQGVDVILDMVGGRLRAARAVMRCARMAGCRSSRYSAAAKRRSISIRCCADG